MVSHEAALVSAADKLHNLTAIVRDVRREGPDTLKRFARPDRIAWYYTAMADALEPKIGAALAGELRKNIEELSSLINKAPHRY